MKKVYAILLVMTLVLGVCGTGMAEIPDWTGSGTVGAQTATFSAEVPAIHYEVDIAYTDPAWEVTYTWNPVTNVFDATVEGTDENGVSLTNKSSVQVFYDVKVVQSTTYTDAELTNRGLELDKPDSAEKSSLAYSGQTGASTTSKLGTVTLSANTAGANYAAISTAIPADTPLATINIVLSPTEITEP